MNRETIAAGLGLPTECLVQLAYCSPNLAWYTKNAREQWIKITESAAIRNLRLSGFTGDSLGGVTPAQVDGAFLNQ